VSPTPQPSKVRPGASSSMVAMDDAVTVGWRLIGFARSVPMTIRSVARAAAARRTYVSRRRSCESGWSAASQPSVSARRTSAAKRSTERESNRFSPKRGTFMTTSFVPAPAPSWRALVDDLARSYRVANPGERPDLRRGIAVEDDQIGGPPALDRSRPASRVKALGRCGGQRGEDRGESEARALEQHVFVGRIVVGHVPDVGAENDLATRVHERTQLRLGIRLRSLDGHRGHTVPPELPGPE